MTTKLDKLDDDCTAATAACLAAQRAYESAQQQSRDAHAAFLVAQAEERCASWRKMSPKVRAERLQTAIVSAAIDFERDAIYSVVSVYAAEFATLALESRP